MVHRVVLKPAELATRLAILKRSADPVFIYFTADRPEPGGERWCPDCRSAQPVIDEAAQAAPASATLLEVEIDRPSWKNDKDSFLRKPPYSVSSIPCVAVWDGASQSVVQRFTEGEAEQLEALQAAFMGSNFEAGA
jgi:thiol-disulfide isomerase/thioredoxin